MILRGIFALAGLLALFVSGTAAAQDDLIVVTASRSDRGDYNRFYDEEQSAIGLTRRADFFVTPIYVNSDSREVELRNEEMFAMLADAISKAEREGITLVAGDYALAPLTREHMRDLTIRNAGRPDTSRVQIYARMPLAGDNPRVSSANERVEQFVTDIPVTGRSYINTGGTVLAIRSPEQYRGDVVRAIAEESTRYASMFGSGYGVEIRGLDSELYWQQASETEVFLFIEHNFVIRPR